MALNSGLWLPQDKPDYPELDPLDPINRGLVGFWPLGEGRGKVARDLCTPGNNGSLNSFAAYSWEAGRQGGQALVFNGASHIVTANNLPVGSTFSVGAWVKLGAAATAYQRILETAFGSAFYLGTNTNGSKFDFIVNSSSGLELCIGGTPTIGKKQFVYGVYDGTTSFLFVDGLQVASVARTAPSISLPLYFGRASGGSTQFWNGAMECVRYHNRALSPSEIYRLYTEQWAGTLQDDTSAYRIAVAGNDGVGSSVGIGAASGVGASLSASVASSTGTGAAPGIGKSLANSVASSVALAAGTGVAKSLAKSVGSSTGVAAATGVGTFSGGGARGTAAGASTVSGVGASRAASVGTAFGTATAIAVATAPYWLQQAAPAPAWGVPTPPTPVWTQVPSVVSTWTRQT